MASAQRDGHPAEYRWRPVLNAAKFGSCPLLECRAVMLPIGERKTSKDAKWILHVAKFRYEATATENENVCIVYQPRALPIWKFGWPTVSDVAAVTLPRRKTHWNL